MEAGVPGKDRRSGSPEAQLRRYTASPRHIWWMQTAQEQVEFEEVKRVLPDMETTRSHDTHVE